MKCYCKCGPLWLITIILFVIALILFIIFGPLIPSTGCGPTPTPTPTPTLTPEPQIEVETQAFVQGPIQTTFFV